jgi:hypothetical protein
MEKGAKDTTTESDTDSDAKTVKPAKGKPASAKKSATDSDDSPKAGSKRKADDAAILAAAAKVIMEHSASEKAARDAEVQLLKKQIRLLTKQNESMARTAKVMTATSSTTA